jgi:hypothetical protein
LYFKSLLTEYFILEILTDFIFVVLGTAPPSVVPAPVPARSGGHGRMKVLYIHPLYLYIRFIFTSVLFVFVNPIYA